MKLVSHGKKLKRFRVCHEFVESFVQNFRLMILCHICYENSNKGYWLLLKGGTETSSFHHPSGEISVKLDDVFGLLHLPIV